MEIDVPTDEELAARAQHGCAAACETLLARVRPSLVHYLCLRTGRLDLAEDLTQETLLRAVQKLYQYDPRRSLRAWLYTIASRIGVRRSLRHSITPIPPGQVWLPSQARPEDRLIADESAHRLWCHLAVRLSLDDLLSLWLTHTEGLSNCQVGQVLGRPSSLIKARLYRARQKLRRQLLVVPPPDLADWAAPKKTSREATRRPSRRRTRMVGMARDARPGRPVCR